MDPNIKVSAIDMANALEYARLLAKQIYLENKKLPGKEEMDMILEESLEKYSIPREWYEPFTILYWYRPESSTIGRPGHVWAHKIRGGHQNVKCQNANSQEAKK